MCGVHVPFICNYYEMTEAFKCREPLGPQGPQISFGHHYHPYSFITGANNLRY